MNQKTENLSTWLIGAGPMAVEYTRVLLAADQKFTVIGRSELKATHFEESTGVPVQRGGVAAALELAGPPARAVVAVEIDQLAFVTSLLLKAGTTRVLVEKPAGLNTDEVRQLARRANDAAAEVLVAYNRRFYASVERAKTLIEADGGVTSFYFDLTERSHEIAVMDRPDGVKASWFMGNTSHVVDLVISLFGELAEMSTYVAGSLTWHPSASRFTGSGLTDQGIPFSYHGDWDAPGRWGIELFTRERRLVFRPIEGLQMEVHGSGKLEAVEIDDRLDREFKPGLYRQTLAFLGNDDTVSCTLEEHLRHCSTYDQMAGYR